MCIQSFISFFIKKIYIYWEYTILKLIYAYKLLYKHSLWLILIIYSLCFINARRILWAIFFVGAPNFFIMPLNRLAVWPECLIIKYIYPCPATMFCYSMYYIYVHKIPALRFNLYSTYIHYVNIAAHIHTLTLIHIFVNIVIYTYFSIPYFIWLLSSDFRKRKPTQKNI